MTSTVQASRLARFDNGAAVLGRVKGRLRRPLRGFALVPSCAGRGELLRDQGAILRFCSLGTRAPVIPLISVPSAAAGDTVLTGVASTLNAAIVQSTVAATVPQSAGVAVSL